MDPKTTRVAIVCGTIAFMAFMGAVVAEQFAKACT